jgi:hypothetical protein
MVLDNLKNIHTRTIFNPYVTQTKLINSNSKVNKTNFHACITNE